MLLAQAGLTLAVATSAADPAHAAIRQAEGSARRECRGMHDGGFQAFANDQGRTVNFGTIHVSTFHLRRIGDRASGYNADGTARQAAVEEAPSRVAHRHAVEAIHGYGRRFGLPRDSSRLGHGGQASRRPPPGTTTTAGGPPGVERRHLVAGG